MPYIPTIGLEIHVQLGTQSKMFCACSNKGEFEDANTTICPICTAQPGTLPTINKTAVLSVIQMGLALHCKIHRLSQFARKNYFYPDLPKGYQISQYELPLCYDGFMEVEGGKIIRITRIHLEEDTAKLFHRGDLEATLVDFNRAGSPLMELVSEPDFESAQEAKAFCQELQLILRYLKISDADMENGHMRCEANVSVRPLEETRLGTKVEVKNINSFRSVERAITYEIQRQSEVLDRGEKIAQETRGWSDTKQKTISQRVKESAHDYRYFPDPDLPPLELEESLIEKYQCSVPELPMAKRKRFMEEYSLSHEQGHLLSAERDLADWVENVISELRRWLSDMEQPVDEERQWREKHPALIKLMSGWITSELFKLMNESHLNIARVKITPENFAELIILLYEKKMNSTAGQMVLREMFQHGADPTHVLEEKKLAQVEDEQQLKTIIEGIICEYPSQSLDYRAGKTNVIQFLIGKTMAATQGKANPEKVRRLLEESLAKD